MEAEGSEEKAKVEAERRRRTLAEKPLVAMVGLLPLPGSPGYRGSEGEIVERALADVEVYAAGGAEAVLVENSGDVPYIKPPLEAEAIRLVRRIAELVRGRFRGPVGLQLLEAANEQALEVAAGSGLDFVRVEGYVFAHIGGAGLIEGCAGKLLRLRKRLRAEGVQVYADIRKKHCAHGLTQDLGIAEHARQAEFFHADGLVVTGPRTGAEPSVKDLEAVGEASGLPLWIGSGMQAGNLARYFGRADGFIVGSCFREGGAFLGQLEPGRFARFMDHFRRLKSGNGG